MLIQQNTLNYLKNQTVHAKRQNKWKRDTQEKVIEHMAANTVLKQVGMKFIGNKNQH